MRSYQPRLLLFIFLIWNSFNAFGQYQTNGNAFSTSCNCHTLTQAVNSQVGSAWNTNMIDLSVSFDFTFDVFLGCSDGGADGIVFALQSVSTTVGVSGSGMGMGGVSPSLGVYLDTYENGADGDPWYDHISINRDGDIVHTSGNNLVGPVQISAATTNVEDCANHTLQITWNSVTQTFEVFFDGSLRLSYTGDIVTTIFGGNSNVYWGFTAATGGLNNEQRFCHNLVADYAVSASGCTGSTFNFIDGSSTSLDVIQSWSWDFDNNGTTDNTSQNPTYTYSTPGTYRALLTVSDISGCTDTISKLINVTAGLTVTSVKTDIVCNADCNGAVDLTITGGATPYSYKWSNGLTIEDISSLCSGTYTVTVSDFNSCDQALVFQITSPPVLSLSTQGFYTNCQCPCPGTVWAIPSGGSVLGNGVYTYSWSNGTNNFIVNDLCPGTYTVTITDDNGCKLVSSQTIP